MSPVLPFDITALIIDTIGESKDTNLLKELALVSYSFHQICSKHIFATVKLQNAIPSRNIASSKKGFVELLRSRPDVVKHIRKLTYSMGTRKHPQLSQLTPTHPIFDCDEDHDDYLLPHILPDLLRTISSSQLSRNQRFTFTSGLDSLEPLPDFGSPSPHVSSYHESHQPLIYP